ncbi:hypothetical protein Pmar_PMAR001981 [Perkinsus marinus ATCC 50983]|uniref:Uncharacterized protein n=1 Tax=Perkinsus marinus (strain ATCC 50983 / TXsc) TaxID=423536 RepID=C5LYC8_PERM5|nr:hypothetical protein Pmar_PMAR001981 [Perkinsus marinus ATCC 50983]EEQ98166.1 hypothetical protein Pmar_PMAR001981 [Perkinsus marinus ATCC 50983]|eukprot:XP_002765449.1 hypothetical protein Pmar_PMAR001981 [Perkinsus marinus ATCC 50983]
MFTLCIVPTANLCKPYFEPVYDENNDEGGAPVQYPSDADLLLLLNGIITYGGTSLILGGPNDENSLPHSLMLVILVTMVMSGINTH